MGQVLAVISGKGGTGKTTVSAGIAACLAAEGRRVLAIDLDIGLRNLDISLGMAESAPLSFGEVLSGAYDLDQIMPHPEIPNLYLLTAPVNQAPEDIDIAAFCAMMDRIRRCFDWCILDAPAGLGAGFTLATRPADRVIVVANADPASLRDGACVAGRLRSGAAEMKLVVNRVAPKAYRRMKTTIDDIMDGVGLPLLGMVPEDFNVTLAAARGVPLVLQTKRGAAAACLHIARRLEGRKMPLLRL